MLLNLQENLQLHGQNLSVESFEWQLKHIPRTTNVVRRTEVSLVANKREFGDLMKNLQVCIVLIFVICLPNITFSIEPIGTIGQQLPEKHAFLSNDEILRVVQTHIQIVDVNTGEVVDQFGNLTNSSFVAFSPSSAKHAAILIPSSIPNGDTVQIWDVNTRKQISEWEYESDASINAAFSPIAPLLAISAKSGFHLWNWQTGELIGTMIGERRPKEFCYIRENGRTCGGSYQDEWVFTPNGKHLVVSSRRPDIELWNVETRELEAHFEGHAGNWVEGIAISPDGTSLASYERSNLVYLWDIESRQMLWKGQSGIGLIVGLVFSPDSQHLYVATRTGGLRKFGDNPYQGWDDKVRVWDVKSGQQIDTFGTEEFRFLQTITLSPDAETFLLNYQDAEVLFNIKEKRQHNVWADFVGRWWYNDVELSPDGKTFVSVSSHFIKTWDVASQQLRLLVSAEGHLFRGFAISPDSQQLAVGKYNLAELRNIHTGEIEVKLPSSISYIEKITYGSTGRWFAVSDDWDELAILDLENSDNPQQLHSQVNLGEPTNFVDFGFSKDDVYFAASAVTGINGDYEYWTLLWKRVDDKFVFQYAWNPSFYYLPTFTTTPDGVTVLATTNRNGIQIWELLPDTPQLLTTLSGDGPVQFSPDGRYLFANQDDHLQIWDWQTSRPIKHASFPEYASLSRDGSVLISYGVPGQYQIWNTKNLLNLLPYPVEPRGKKFVTLGQIKRNQLLQNFPNPFNPETWIPFRLADDSNVTIRIYTPTGKLVRSLSPGILSAGDYSSQSQAVHWDGCNNAGEAVSSGIYLYTINAGDFSATRKMLIQK